MDQAPAPAPGPPLVPTTDLSPARGGNTEGLCDGEAVDLTQIPKQLDAQFAALDVDSSLRPTTIKTGARARVCVCGRGRVGCLTSGCTISLVGDIWTKRAQKSLLGRLVQSNMNSILQKTEKDKAFDLLDALTRSVRWAPQYYSCTPAFGD